MESFGWARVGNEDQGLRFGHGEIVVQEAC